MTVIIDSIARADTEHAHQRAFFAWLNYARLFGFEVACQIADQGYSVGRLIAEPVLPELELFHAIPNGGKRDKITAGKLKAEGVKAGVLDTFLPVPRPFSYPHAGLKEMVPAMYHGLYIEFKAPEYATRKNGGVSEAQAAFTLRVQHQGYCVRVAYSWREAANILIAYYHPVAKTPRLRKWEPTK